MAIFKYTATGKNGKRHSDFISAYNEERAVKTLEDRGYTVKAVKGSDALEMKILRIINRVGTKDLVIFSRQFSVMISANLPLVKALKVIVEQTENIKLKMVISDIAFEVDAGARLSDAMAERPGIFSSFYVSIVKSGETSGKLDEVLNYLADEMEKDYNIMSQIKSAMIYPLFVLVGLGVVGFIMMIFIVPKLTEILERTNAELPLSTRIVIATSDFLSAYWWLLLILVFGSVLVMRFLIKHSPFVRKYFDFFKIKLPVFGKLFQYIYIVRITRSMRTLLVSGVTVTKSLSLVAEVVGNQVYREMLEDTLEEVEEGSSLASVFMTRSEMPTMVPQMISVGEKTGKLDLVLEKVTDFYEREVNKLVDNLVTLLEPIIIVVLGVGVGIMIAAILLPMYNLAGQF
jgi:type IV pilus assembly protein PilC